MSLYECPVCHRIHAASIRPLGDVARFAILHQWAVDVAAACKARR